MNSTFHERNVTTILEAVLESTGGEVVVVSPTRTAIEELISVMDVHDGPAVRILADENALKSVMADFLLASAAADLIEADRLSLGVSTDVSSTFLLVTEEAVVAIVAAGDRVAGLTTDDDAFVESARDRYAATLDASEEFRLRTPAISRVRETLAAEIGQDVEADFARVLGSLETARGDGDGLDEVTISLLVAAKNEVLLYDVSKWGEDVGVASKATFSRTKTRLEERGLIDTEKVPIDVGRPRLRLLLGDERLREASADELASVAQSLLSGGLDSA